MIKNKKADFQNLMMQCGISEVLTRCLVNRGYETPEAIKRFIHGSKEHLYDPMAMKDMDIACAIIKDCIESGKKIRIIGDYDVDGIIATFVLYRGLRALGAVVDYEIPDRIKDGYGINIRIVEEANKDGVHTILTCDNGIVAMEQVLRAKELGMTVVVTDHHSLAQVEGKSIIPQADAVVNTKREDCSYPFKELCGAAIAYKLVCALLNQLAYEHKEELEDELISYTAIATVCDVMELIDENRIIVREGLKLLAKTKNKGLLALMDLNQIEKGSLNAFHLGFVIGPCLNASGRLDTAKLGIQLLLSEDVEQASRLAAEVKELNELRKTMTASNVEKAIQLIEDGSMKDDKVLVIHLGDCHESIAGIIAGRIRERFYRPTVVLTDAEDGVKGSGRSIEHYNMIDELVKHRDLLHKVGGHPMAAGLSLCRDNVEILRKNLNDLAELTDEMLVPKVSIDILLPFGYITEELIEELEQLEPFGKGNEKPLFAEKDCKIKSAFIIGKNNNGIKFQLMNAYGRQREAVYFGDVNRFFTYLEEKYGYEEVEKLKTARGSNINLTIVYYPKINEYNGFKSIQLMIQYYR